MIREEHKVALWDDALRQKLVQKVIDVGYVRLEHFFDDESEKKFLDLREVVGENNIKNDQMVGTFADEIRKSEEIFEMCKLIYKTRTELLREPYKDLQGAKQAVGIAYKKASSSAQNKETEFHYDAAYINIVIPIRLPPRTNGDGNLVVFPNLRRKYPRIIAAPLSTFLRRIPFFRKWYGETAVDYSVGALHLFFGDVTLHGVPPIREGERMILTINSHW